MIRLNDEQIYCMMDDKFYDLCHTTVNSYTLTIFPLISFSCP
jgi:hypothetical protein